MADVDGNKLKVGDQVEIVQMDDPAYRRLVGMRGEVNHIPDDPPARDTQVIVVLDDEQVPGVSTHQAWVRKVK